MTPHAPATQVLNCVRVLTRILPFIFESEELMQWEERYFWTSHTVVASSKGCPAPQTLSETIATPVAESEIQPISSLEQLDPAVGTPLTEDQVKRSPIQASSGLFDPRDMVFGRLIFNTS